MSDQEEALDQARRDILRSGWFWLGALVIAPGFIFSGCGPSSGGKTIVVGGNPPPSGGTTTTVAAALTAKYGGYSTRSTTHGNKITSVGNVSGESIVYTVNGQRDDSTPPGSKSVRTGDTIDVFDLVNGTRLSFTVS